MTNPFVLNKIVVGVDASTNSAPAVRWAAGLAGAIGAEVLAVHAMGLLEQLGDDDLPPATHRQAIKDTFETDWCAPLAGLGDRCRKEVRFGSAVQVLLSAAAEIDADLIVVGSRGSGGLPSLLLGSTSTQLAQHSTCPVTIVRHE